MNTSLIYARAAHQPIAKQVRLTLLWTTAWQSASRAISSTPTSRAASHLMNVLLKLRIIPFSSVSDSVQRMLLSIELNGPAVLTDTSSAFLNTIIRERVQENPTHFDPTSERILSWLFSKWTPSKSPLCAIIWSTNLSKVFGMNVHIHP
jgi:serine-protein kinase ATM